MTAATATPYIHKISELLAEKGYEVAEVSQNVLRIRDVDSGVALRAVLEGEILFLSLTCMTVAPEKITPAIMRKMLAADNGISTSHFQLYPMSDGKVAVTLNNFCKLQDMGPEDEDDVLSCVHFLLVDVMEARRVIGDLQ